MPRWFEFRPNPDKKASPRWQTMSITIGAAVVVVAGIVASFTVGGGHFFR